MVKRFAKCRLCKNNQEKDGNGYCKECNSCTPEELAAKLQAARVKKKNEQTSSSLFQYSVYIKRGSDLGAALDERMEKTGETRSEITLKALAKFLKVENPHQGPGRPKVQEVEWA